MQYDLVFEGGGAKGMAFTGALREFERRGHTCGRLMGVSAGAIMATFLAAGYNAAEMSAALDEQVAEKPTFVQFLGVPEQFDSETVRESATRAWLKEADLPFVPDRLEGSIDDWIVEKLLKSQLYRHVFSFVERGGWYSADPFVRWAARWLDSGAYRGQPRRFSQMTLQEFYAATGTDLTLLAADVGHARLLVLNHRTAPDCPVVWAMRMSMSVPLLWQEVIWQAEWGPYRGKDVAGTAVVDGGLLSNFPIELFITNEPMWTAVMGPKQTTALIGMLIDETKPVPNAPAPASASGPGRLPRLRTVNRMMKLVDTVMQARDKFVIESYEQFVVRLPAKGYGTTEFDMPPERRQALVDAAEAEACNYLDGLGGGSPFEFEARGDDDLGEAAQAGFYEQANRIARSILGEPEDDN